MAKIDYEIGQQSFELLRDAIGGFIKSELIGQKAITGNDLFDANVYIERFITFDNIETPCVNVVLNQSNHVGMDWTTTEGNHEYFIDIITGAEESLDAEVRGDTLATINLQRLIATVKYILESGEYRFLGLPQGAIGHRHVERIQIFNPDTPYNPNVSADGLYLIAGRITLVVKATDKLESLATETLADIFTNMTLEESGLGYEIIVENA